MDNTATNQETQVNATTQAALQGESVAFQAEIQQLLDILIHSLYSETDIFLRELISNASDALNRFKFSSLTEDAVHDAGAELAIWLKGDPEAGTLTIMDSGIGMTATDMVQNLGTIAHSGAKDFLRAMQDAKQQGDTVNADVIGQFGVGFYSVFMVADEVRVTSRSHLPEAHLPEANVSTWVSEGKGEYHIEDAEQSWRGTTITISLKDEHKEFAQPYRLRNIVKTHSDFVTFPIYLWEEKSAPPNQDPNQDNEDSQPEAGYPEAGYSVINQQQALWRMPSSDVADDQYKSFYQSLTYDFSDPLMRVHLMTDAPLQLYALLFVPSRKDYKVIGGSEAGVKLYVRKVLIQEKFADFLPQYMRFIEGVVDTEDLPLNVSRQMVQNNAIIKKISDVLVKRILSELERTAKGDPAQYEKLWLEFGSYLKEGIASDHANKTRLAKLVRFRSSKSQDASDWISLERYVERAKTDQDEIYYVIADSYEAATRSPHLEYFRKHDIEVLYFSEDIDSYMLFGLDNFEGKTLKNVDDAELNLPAGDEPAEDTAADGLEQNIFAAVVERFKSVLGERVVDVKESKLLTDSPCRLVNPKDATNTSMQRLQRLMGENNGVPKKILEINRHSALIASLASKLDSDSQISDAIIEQLFDSALLAEGIHPDPASMVERIQTLMEAAAKQ
jgi:molecular chaperone HtpG